MITENLRYSEKGLHWWCAALGRWDAQGAFSISLTRRALFFIRSSCQLAEMQGSANYLVRTCNDLWSSTMLRRGGTQGTWPVP